MRYHQIMAEAIPHRPRDFKVYLTNRIRELDQMLKELAQAAELVRANERDGESVLRYAIRSGIEDTPFAGNDTAIWHLTNLNLEREFSIERLKESLDSYLRYSNSPGYDFLRFVMSTLEDVAKYAQPEYRQQYSEGFKLLPYAETGLQRYGYEPGNPEHEADPDYIAAKNLLAGYRLKAKVFARIVPLEDDLRVKLGVIQRMKAHDYSGKGSESYRPEHDEVETLYHATAFMTEILRDGFQAEKPIDRKGLGNFGHQESISFTHDLEVARNIMRSFKEIWMITHGQLTGRQIMGWAQAEGIEDQVKQGWRNETSAPLPLATSDPKQIVKLYRFWQWFTKLRQNPVMTSPWEMVDVLQDRSLKDIGVLSCRVKLEDTDAYQFAEAEFRLSADRVLPGTLRRVL